MNETIHLIPGRVWVYTSGWRHMWPGISCDEYFRRTLVIPLPIPGYGPALVIAERWPRLPLFAEYLDEYCWHQEKRIILRWLAFNGKGYRIEGRK